jgi:hypothetical protein
MRHCLQTGIEHPPAGLERGAMRKTEKPNRVRTPILCDAVADAPSRSTRNGLSPWQRLNARFTLDINTQSGATIERSLQLVKLMVGFLNLPAVNGQGQFPSAFEIHSHLKTHLVLPRLQRL